MDEDRVSALYQQLELKFYYEGKGERFPAAFPSYV